MLLRVVTAVSKPASCVKTKPRRPALPGSRERRVVLPDRGGRPAAIARRAPIATSDRGSVECRTRVPRPWRSPAQGRMVRRRSAPVRQLHRLHATTARLNRALGRLGAGQAGDQVEPLSLVLGAGNPHALVRAYRLGSRASDGGAAAEQTHAVLLAIAFIDENGAAERLERGERVGFALHACSAR
jgi:hypothetical protein